VTKVREARREREREVESEREIEVDSGEKRVKGKEREEWKS